MLRRGGERPTVTDANVMLGRMPQTRRWQEAFELDREAAEQTVGTLAGELGLDTMACAEGIVRVAEAEMAARAAPDDGGARRRPARLRLDALWRRGPLHAASLAEELGMGRCCAREHRACCARSAWQRRRQTARCAAQDGDGLQRRDELSTDAARVGGVRWSRWWRRRRAARLGGRRQVGVRVRYELRYRGQSFELGVEEAWPRAATWLGRGDVSEWRADDCERASRDAPRRCELRLSRRDRRGGAGDHPGVGAGSEHPR